MKKTIQINLSGVVFMIDEDAYFKLSDYLDAISGMFSSRQGREEIMADIEARIAELFNERLNENKQVIGLADVDAVIATLGQPEEFADPEAENNYGSEHFENASRKLYRDPDDRVIGGVCSGFGHYLGVDAIWLRIAFLVAFFGFGFGFLLYILLWIVVPKARTRAEKLQMRGQPVNLGNIGRSIEDEFDSLRSNYRSSKKKAQVGAGIEQGFHTLGRLIARIFIIIGKILGALFVLFGSLVSIGMIAALIGEANFINLGGGGYSVGFSLFEFGDLIFEPTVQLIVALTGAVLFLLVPFLALTYAGLKLLSSQRVHVPFLGLAFFVLWVIGLSLCAYSAIRTAHQFSKEESLSEMVLVKNTPSDTLTLKIGQDEFNIDQSRLYHVHDDFLIKVKEDSIHFGNVRLNIETSVDSLVAAKVVRTASGATHAEARERAENIHYKVGQNQNVLLFPSSFSFHQDDRLRNQDVEINVLLPEGMSVYLEKGMERILYDVRNTSNTYDPKMPGHHWKMTPEGLACTDCPEE